MPFDLRTNPSVDGGISLESRAGDGTRTVVYQPGNGTRYVLVITDLSELPGEAKAELGHGGNVPGLFMITRMVRWGGKSMLVAGPIHWKEVREAKLATGVSDAVVLAEVIGYLTGFKAMSCQEFEDTEGGGF